MRNMVIALAALAAAATPAQALTSLADTFDTENGGVTALNYTGWANFTAEGGVDLVKSGDFGISCTGMCVDLDGSPGPGALRSANFTYGNGYLYEFTFSIGGNQRVAGSDTVFFELYDAATNTLLDSSTTSIAWDSPFVTFSDSYTFSGDGSFYFKIGSTSSDNQGPLLDSVQVAAIPEPGTWAMMIGGFALIGASMRRRSVRVQFA